MTAREGFERLEREIVHEKAATLGRAGERLEAALAAARALGHTLDAERDPARREALERCGGFQADHPLLASVRRRVADRLREITGLGIELTLVAPHTIPRSEGKAVRVIERS